MTAYLADTHVVLWFWQDPNKLSKGQLDVLTSASVIYVSAASVWEASIKAGLGRLTLPASMSELLETDGFRLLPITAAHAEAVRDLPLHHRDPFDRMLIVQAQIEGLTVLSADAKFAAYDIKLI